MTSLSTATLPCSDGADSSLQCKALEPPKPAQSYASQWNQVVTKRQRPHVLDAAFHQDFLAVCTSLGQVDIFKVPLGEKQECSRIPTASIQVCDGSLSRLMFVRQEEQSKVLLATNGTKGIVCYDWNQILKQLQLCNNTLTTSLNVEPVVRFQTNNVMCHYLEETNIHDVHVDDSFLYAATDNGCYKYNMGGQQVSSNFSLKRVNRVVGIGNNQTILLGNQDGTMEVWNQERLTDTLDTSVALQKHTTTFSSHNHRIKTWITGICVDKDPFWVVSGGFQKRGNSSRGGFLLTLHGPSLSVVSASTTREFIHNVVSTSSLVVTVGNEGVVSTWNSLNTTKTGRAWCSPPSGHALSHRTQDGLVVVGGVGHVLDVFDADMTTRLYSLFLE